MVTTSVLTMTNKLPPLKIVDLSAVMKQAYHSGSDPDAIKDPETGELVNTWRFGVQRLLERYADELFGANSFDPNNTIVCHDQGTDYRKALYPEYKANRAKRNRTKTEVSQLFSLKEWITGFLTSIGVLQGYVKGVEADDLIAYICEGFHDVPKEVYTVDGDLTVLADDNTIVFLKDGPHWPGESDGYKGIPYHLVSFSKSILGDTSDNYSGVKGMGPAAWEALMELGTDVIESLRDAVDNNNSSAVSDLYEVHGTKELKKLVDNFAEWRVSWLLAKLHPELCWKPRCKTLTKVSWNKQVPNPVEAKKYLDMAGAGDFWPIFEERMPRIIPVDASAWAEMKDDIFAEIRKGDVTAFDYESYDTVRQESLQQAGRNGYVDMLNQKITGASFCFGKYGENVIYMSVDHADTDNCSPDQMLELLAYADEHTQLVAHNAYFELTVTARNFGVRLSDVHDTQLMLRYVDENAEFGLKAAGKRDLSYKMATYEETTKGRQMNQISLAEVLQYGADDSLVTFHLYTLYRFFSVLDGVWDIYLDRAVDATPTMVEAFLSGTHVDWELQAKVHAADIIEAEESHKEMHKIFEDNCSNPTPEAYKAVAGYIQEEGKYMARRAKRLMVEDRAKKGLPEPLFEEIEANQKAVVDRFKEKTLEAVAYHPFAQTEVMSEFKPTATQLTQAAQAIGMPPVEKVTLGYINKYLDDNDYGTFGTLHDESSAKFLEGLAKLLDCKAFSTGRDSAEAQEVLEWFGPFCQKAMGVEPKIVTSGDPLDLGSVPQKVEMFYAKMGLPIRTRSKLSEGRMVLGFKEGSPATNEIALLTALSEDVRESGDWRKGAIEQWLRCQSARTRISLYHNTYPLWKRADSGKIHPSFMLCGTDTRRPTGGSPNLLQVSKKDKRMRQMFIPPSPQFLVVAIDFNAQEIRLMASESGDPVMISVYDPTDEKDLHSMTASAIAGMSYEAFCEAYNDEEHSLHEVCKAWRKKAKTVNFGLAYGAGASTIARNLIIPLEEAKMLVDKTMGLYKGLGIWQEESAKEMLRNGFTLSASGAKRHGDDDLFSRDNGKVASWQRRGTNFKIQGSAADMLNWILTQIWRTGMFDRLRFNLLAPVYDEIVSYVHVDDVVQYCKEMGALMRKSTPAHHVVPQVPEFSIGYSWGTVHEAGREATEENLRPVIDRALKEGQERLWNRVTL